MAVFAPLSAARAVQPWGQASERSGQGGAKFSVADRLVTFVWRGQEGSNLPEHALGLAKLEVDT